VSATRSAIVPPAIAVAAIIDHHWPARPATSAATGDV
jgi:hypothetical protein